MVSFSLFFFWVQNEGKYEGSSSVEELATGTDIFNASFLLLCYLYSSYLSLFCLTTILNWKFISGVRVPARSRIHVLFKMKSEMHFEDE